MNIQKQLKFVNAVVVECNRYDNRDDDNDDDYDDDDDDDDDETK